MSFTRRRVLIGAGSMVLATTVPATIVPATTVPALGAQIAVIGGLAFGTSWRIILPSGSDIANARLAVEKIIRSIDVAMSPFRANSEISRFNRHETTNWITLSTQTSLVIDAALRIANSTYGAFDPTIGPIVGRYGFGPITNVSTGNHTNIAIRTNKVKKHYPSLSLDLCGIAKGHALDRMTRALDMLDIQSFLIELGGEIFARGQHPSGRLWQVGIEQPILRNLQFQRLIGLKNMALATSGDAVNGYNFGGLRYSHIIDPRSGKPVRNGVASVSVITPKGMIADALATALMVLGPEQGVNLAEQENLDTLFIVRDGSGLREIVTGNFTDHILT